MDVSCQDGVVDCYWGTWHHCAFVGQMLAVEYCYYVSYFEGLGVCYVEA